MKLYFVRHGETNYNIKNLCNDNPNTDVHLTTLGKQQANNVANQLDNIIFNKVYISEFPRTKETALLILKNKKTTLKIDSRINDRKTGFNGKPVPDFFKAIESDKFNIKIKNSESFQEEKERVFSFLKDLKNSPHDNILIVTHSEILQIINGYFNNLSDQEMWDTKIDNCEIIKITI